MISGILDKFDLICRPGFNAPEKNWRHILSGYLEGENAHNCAGRIAGSG